MTNKTSMACHITDFLIKIIFKMYFLLSFRVKIIVDGFHIQCWYIDCFPWTEICKIHSINFFHNKRN